MSLRKIVEETAIYTVSLLALCSYVIFYADIRPKLHLFDKDVISMTVIEDDYIRNFKDVEPFGSLDSVMVTHIDGRKEFINKNHPEFAKHERDYNTILEVQGMKYHHITDPR